MGVGDQIGALFVAIGADLSGLQSAIGPGGKADKQLEGFTTRINNGLLGIAKVGAFVAGGVLLAIAGGLAIATHEAGNFQSKLTQLVTGAGESQKNIGLVSDGLLKMAGDTGTSAMSLADGLYMIESAGYHGAEGLAVLQAAAEGAKVGNADLSTTADAVTTVLKDYHMPATQAADATNFLIGVVSQGKTHMQDLAQSLAMVLPFASALGVPLDQVGGAMATMTAKGVPAADAATYLRFTMAALANETPKGKKALEEIGLKSEDVSKSLTTRGLLPTLQMLQDALGKKFKRGSAEYFAALSDIVGGTRGLSAALQLTGGNLQDFITNTKGVSDQIAAGHGQILGWTKVQGDMNFQVQAGQAALEAAGIKIGTKLLPPLTELLKNVIVPLIPKLADLANTWLNNLLPPVEQFAGWLSTLRPDFQKAYDIISTLKPYLIDVGAAWIAWNIALAVTKALNMASMALQFVGGLIQIVRTVGMATAAQWLLNIAMDANPIGVVIIALGLLAAAFIWAYNNVTPFRDAVNGVWSFLQQFGSWIQAVFGPLMQGLGQVFSDIGKGDWGAVLRDVGNLHLGSYVQGQGGSESAAAASVTKNRGTGGLSFDVGGIVPGPIGAPVLATVHGGERVLTPAQQRRGGGGDMQTTNALLARLIEVVTATPGGQTGVEAALYKAVHLSGMNRARGMAGA